MTNPAKQTKLSEAEFQAALAATEPAADSRRLHPTWDALAKEFPSSDGVRDGVVFQRDHEGNIVGATLRDSSPDKHLMKRWLAMTQPARDREFEVGQNEQAQTFPDREWVRNAETGERDHVPMNGAAGYESENFKRKFLGGIPTFNRWSKPQERKKVVRKPPPILKRMMAKVQRACPICGCESDRNVANELAGLIGDNSLGGICSRCERLSTRDSFGSAVA